MRAADRPLPTVTLDATTNLAAWPVRPVLAVDTGTGWVDATCDLYGFTLKIGPADDHFDFPPAELNVQLDNRAGDWSRIAADGTPTAYGPGTKLSLWAHYPGSGGDPAAVVLVEPFDNLSNWTGTATIVAGRTGTAAQIAGSSTLTYTIAAAARKTTATIGVAYNVSNVGTATRSILSLRDAANADLLTLRVETNGTLSLLLGGTAGSALGASAPGLIAAGVYYFVELSALINDTTGNATVRVNNTTVISVTNVDTRIGSAGPSVGIVFLRGPGSGQTAKFDDLYLRNDQTFGLAPPATDEWIAAELVATAWNQTSADVVEIVAFDTAATLAQPVGAFTAGTTGDLPGTRAAAVLGVTGRTIPNRFDAGVVALTAQETKLAPLEDLQAVVASDGGVVFVDADGTVVSFGRDWRRGRPDQVTRFTISDNVCSGIDAVIWDASIVVDDDAFSGYVVLSTVAGLKSTAGTPTAPFVYAESDLQFANIGEGNSVADAVLQHQRTQRATLDDFAVHVNDPRQPQLATLVALRPLDRVDWKHTERAAGGGTFTLTGSALVVGVEHSMSVADGWNLVVNTIAADNIATLLYWDQADPFTWDDPGALWS